MIAGDIADSTTGVPIPFVAVRSFPLKRIRAISPAPAFSDVHGHSEGYDDTGFYLLKVQPGTNTGYASQWCSGADDSTKATPVLVSTNCAVTADFGFIRRSHQILPGGPSPGKTDTIQPPTTQAKRLWLSFRVQARCQCLFLIFWEGELRLY